jgi:hypothetical protein
MISLLVAVYVQALLYNFPVSNQPSGIMNYRKITYPARTFTLEKTRLDSPFGKNVTFSSASCVGKSRPNDYCASLRDLKK